MPGETGETGERGVAVGSLWGSRGGKPERPRGRRALGGGALPVAVLAMLALLGAECEPQSERGTRGSPFTGDRKSGDRVLAVKVDNSGPARPHTGLDRADLVYVEQVESGMSRLLAVFASDIPRSVGPIRSARESDLELLRQFGQPALAYSGAQSKLRPELERAPLTPLPPGELDGGYRRGGDRPAPHNLYLDPERALREAPEASEPSDIGFRFGSAPEGGRKLARHSVNYPSSSFTFDWSAERERWQISMDGTPARTDDGKRLDAATVVVQYVKVRSSEYQDSSGNVSPYTETVGSGKAEVLRGGKKHRADWSRPSAGGGTTFTDEAGERINFARGPVWVVLAPQPKE